jgi:hypothetical protein
MGCRILEDREDGFACMYDSVTMTAFGPVFDDGQQLENFMAWLGPDTDPRKLDDNELSALLAKFLEHEESLPEAVRNLPFALRDKSE